MLAARLVLLVGLWLSVLGLNCAESRKFSWDVASVPNACPNCTICQYSCHPLAPPPPPYGYPVYGGGAPPPPPPPGDPSGYPVYDGPPTPFNCTPFPAQCCHYPPPYPYGYQPYENRSACSSPLAFISLVLLLLSVAFSSL